MSQTRLTLALDGHGLELPATGDIAVFAPRAGADLGGIAQERVRVIQPNRVDYDAFRRAGYACDVEEQDCYAAAIVFLPRAKQQARDLIARAVAVADLVIVDGQKTDGIDSILKDCKKRAEVEGVLSKAHGKLFWFSDGDFDDWRAAPAQVEGFVTRAGVFSADGIDPASKLLAQTLPAKLGRNVADLGAGWGYLAREVLTRDTVETLYLVEADHVALECARENITDPRAEFHWADATTWEARAKMDAVVMNPPFHTGRAAEPALGEAFIAAAARMLAPTGQLWLVANRHLPYEATLQACFGQVEEVAGDGRFKVLHATRPIRRVTRTRRG